MASKLQQALMGYLKREFHKLTIRAENPIQITGPDHERLKHFLEGQWEISTLGGTPEEHDLILAAARAFAAGYRDADHGSLLSGEARCPQCQSSWKFDWAPPKPSLSEHRDSCRAARDQNQKLVLKVYPDAVAHQRGRDPVIWSDGTMNLCIGFGGTLDEAWEDAASRIRKRG